MLTTITKCGSFRTLSYCILLLLTTAAPLQQAAAQRSQYDLAAWLNAAMYDSDTVSANWALKEGLDINYKRGNGPALFIAIFWNRPEMVTFLLRKGANPQVTNDEGLTALQYAEKQGKPEIVSLLKQHLNIKDTTADKPANSNATPANQTPTTVGTWKVGDVVLHSRDRGKTWEKGTIVKITTDPLLTTDGQPKYLVEDVANTVRNYYDANFITTLTCQPSWTSFFVGDWDLHLPIAGGDRVIGKDVYTVYGGGDKLPPLRINANGTYSWTIDKKKVIKGKWKPNTDAPGIILLNGDKNTNWLVYNTTDANNRKIYKTDYIILNDGGYQLARHGFRIQKKKG